MIYTKEYYLTAQVERLKARIRELEAENAELRAMLSVRAVDDPDFVLPWNEDTK